MRKLICLSGGIDSTVALYLNVAFPCEVLLFDYDQQHVIELQYAVNIVRKLNIPYTRVKLPKLTKTDDVVFGGRNLLFASTAVAIAASRGFNSVVVGCNKSDWTNFPDCRPCFWDSFDSLSYEAYKVNVETPLLYMTKADIVTTARKLQINLDDTWSCYSPINNGECGMCLACKTKQEAISTCSQ